MGTKIFYTFKHQLQWILALHVKLIKSLNESLRSVMEGCQHQLKSAALLFVNLICLVTKLSVNSLSLGRTWSLRVIINYSALSSTSRQLGGLPKRHQESHYWRASSSPMNYTSLICLCCFCTVMDIKEQDSSAPWAIIPLAMLLIVFSLTVLHSDINLEMEQ